LTGATTHQIAHWVRRRVILPTKPAGPNTAFTEPLPVPVSPSTTTGTSDAASRARVGYRH
jgi:hypothetical protein